MPLENDKERQKGKEVLQEWIRGQERKRKRLILGTEMPSRRSRRMHPLHQIVRYPLRP